MYPSGWPDEVHIDGLKLRYTSDTKAILVGLSSTSKAESTANWVGAIAYALDSDSQDLLIAAIKNRDMSGLGLMVLANRLSQDALGLDLLAASTLAGGVLGSWFPIAAWAAGKGMRIADLHVHELLAACYAVQLEQCKEDRDVDRLNRKIFSSSHPWGR